MRRWLLLLLLPVGVTASVAPPVEQASVGERLGAARAEADAAERRAAALDAAAARAGDDLARLRAELQAAAAAIEAAEARIAAADAALEQVQAALGAGEARLAARRAPVAALLAGIATMGRQPPLMSLADGASPGELVRLRALLDTTMPRIEADSAALRGEVARQRQLADRAAAARADLAASRRLLDQRRVRFANLERAAAARSATLSGEAFGAEERVLAQGETVGELGGEAAAAAAARGTARQLAALDLAQPRPVASAEPAPAPTLPYSLPSPARVIEGLGAVSPFGVRSRGVRLASARRAALMVPADGIVRFAGPYRSKPGLVIIDHGGGWTSLLIGVQTALEPGAQVSRGDPLGSALGPLDVELRRHGQPYSAALIAGSSARLSNGPKNR